MSRWREIDSNAGRGDDMFQHSLPEQRRINGAVVEFEQCGTGRELVYLHGCDGVSLDDSFVPSLSDAFHVKRSRSPVSWVGTAADDAFGQRRRGLYGFYG